MTSPDSIDLREVIFINERCRKDYFDLPEDVVETADQAIDALQNGRQLPPKMFTKLSGSLAGIDEIRILMIPTPIVSMSCRSGNG